MLPALAQHSMMAGGSVPVRRWLHGCAWLQRLLLVGACWHCLNGAAEIWVQTTDVDFGSSTRTGLVITGSGGAAVLTLDPAALAALPATGTVVSPSFDTGMYARLVLSWEAATPAGSGVRFQVRTATTEAGLASAVWRGPSGSETWFSASATEVGLAAGALARWLQYKAELSTAVDGALPQLESVTVTYTPADVLVTANTTWPEDGYVVGNLTISNAATLTIGGGSTVRVDGVLRLSGNATVLCLGANTSAKVSGEWAGVGVALQAAEVSIEVGSAISADGQGYKPVAGGVGNGPGGGYGVAGTIASGAGHGGAGGGNPAGYGLAYGSAEAPEEPGSAGGGCVSGGLGGPGGGALRLVVAGTLSVDGRISANAGARSGSWYPGGGAGGSIWITTGALAGSGGLQANGSAGGLYGDGGGGGGGRIAVYYGADTGFSGFATATTAAGTGGAVASAGTIAFFCTASANPHLYVYQRFELPLGAVRSYSAITTDNGATLTLGGGAQISVDGTITVTGASTIVCASRNDTGPLDGEWQGEGVRVQAGDVVVASGSALSADGQGYKPVAGGVGNGPGGGHGVAGTIASGAGHGGAGGGNPAGYGLAYGSAEAPEEPGSAGGGCVSGGLGGPGGGALRLVVARTLSVDGRISANAGARSGSWYPGGGAGGSLWITAATLTGSGTLQANGSAGGLDVRGGGGGGGRIAVYYGVDGGFGGLATASASAGSGGAAARPGTIAFFCTVADRLQLTVHQSFELPAGAIRSYSAITLDQGATLAIGGGSRVTVDGTLRVAGNSTVLCQGRDRERRVDGQWAGRGVEIEAGDVIVESGSRISADGQGYTAATASVGNGPGGGYGAVGTIARGAGYGGRGGGELAGYGDAYGDPGFPVDLGSAGGGCQDGGLGGDGGGAILLNVAGTLTVDGALSANANPVRVAWYPGGGAGGSIIVNARAVTGSGTVSADGSNGGAYDITLSGGGGGGRIAVYWWDSLALPEARITVSAGDSRSAWPAQPGSKVLSSTPAFLLLEPAAALTHGVQALRWTALACDPAALSVDLSVSQAGRVESLGSGLAARGVAPWDTTRLPDGLQELRAVFRDRSGAPLGTVVREVMVNNAAAWHRGRIAADETWEAGRLHIVEGAVEIAAGVRVTFSPGCIVKLAQGIGIAVAEGAILDASGSAAAAVVLTALADDSVAGDSNADGDRSAPRPGDWSGVAVLGTGQFVTNEFTDLRYTSSRHLGSLTTDEVWMGTNLHHVTGNIAVPSGLTLTINPGAVVKFDPGCSLEVLNGGTLVARGSPTRAITFTSMRDDTIAGDSNGDGNRTAAAPGDWCAVSIVGGTALLEHVDLRYGGAAPGGGQAAMLSVTDNASLTVDDSFLRAAFYDGVLGNSGTAVLRNCVVTGSDRAVVIAGTGTLRVTNCTLDDNRLGLFVHGGQSVVQNTIISNSIEHGISRDGGTCELSHCDVWAPGGTGYDEGMGDQTGRNGNLSADPLYRSPAHGDFRLGYRSPCIDAADTVAAPETDLMGAPRYDDPRCPNTGVPAPAAVGGMVYADLGAYEFVENAVSDIDLVVSAVVGPATAEAGQTATLRWTVRNRGSAAARGPWHDTVALVRTLDGTPVAIRVGEVLVGSGVILGAGESLSASADVRVPGGVAAEYRWQVTTNGRGEVFEGANAGNNTAVSAQPVALALPALTVGGGALAGQFAGVGEEHWFAFRPEPGQDIQLNLDLADAGGAVELYIGAGYVPSPQHFDSRQTEWSSAHVSALALGTSAQTYYVLVRNTALSGSGGDFTLDAAVLEFQLTSCSPSTVGNSGAVTLCLRGGELGAGMSYQLQGPARAVHEATTVQAVDPSQVYATFDLTGAAPGRYTVRVSDGGRTAALDGAVSVVAAGPGRFQVNVVMPALVRVGRVFRAYVEYSNLGAADLVTPILYVRSVDGARFSRDLSAPPTVTEEEFLAAATPGPAGILRPGQRVSVPLLVQAIRGTTRLEVSYIDAANAAPMAWAYMEDRLASTHGADPQFAAVLAAMRVRIGTTWGDYDRMLAANASLLPAALGAPADLNRLLGLQYRRVQASLGASISGSVDASALGRSPAGLRLGAVPDAGAGRTWSTYILNDGSFALPTLSAGTYLLQVQGAEVESTVPATLSVAPGTPLAGVVVTVARQELVTGTVRDAAGVALPAGALVSVLAGTDVVGTGMTDASGRYEVAGVLPGTYSFVVIATGQAQTTRDNVEVVAGNATVDLTVQPQAVICGTALLPSGAAAARLFVFATPSAGAAPLALFSAAGADDGTFVVPGLPAGTYDLSFSDFSAGIHEAAVAGIEIATGGRLDLGGVTLSSTARAVAGKAAGAGAGAGVKGLSMAGTDDDSIYEPGSAEPLRSGWDLKVLAAKSYLRLSLLPTEYELFGVEVSTLWNEYISSTSADPVSRLSYGADSQIVEGATTPFGSGFRSYDLKDGTENGRVQQIRAAVLAGVKAKFRSGTLTCDQIIESNGSKVFLLTVGNFPGLEFRFGGTGTAMHNLLNLTGYPYTTPTGETDINDQMGSYSGAYNIPSNIAGGAGTAQPFPTPGSGSGQQYHDTRHWTGLVRATVAGKGQVTLHYEVDWVVNDTIDFRPGDLGIPIQHALTVPMAFLETVGQAFDVPFQVQYRDERFTPQTFTIDEGEPPECPDPERPPRPETPGGGGGTPSNEATDPNELVGPAGVGPQGFVPAAQVFPYTIHFENMATATAPAQQVVVTTVLDPDLDRSTLELVQIRCNDAVIDVPAGLQEYTTEVSVGSDPNPVRVSVRFEPASGRITWDLQSVDPLTGLLVEDPLAGFLPPNTAAPAGEGTVSFTVRPQPGLATGTRITGQASIVFDVNAPILTNTALNTLDAGAPVARVTALPAVLPYAEVAVRWSGTDDYGGSGVVAYDLFVATDGGPFTVWLSRSTATSAVFAGERGHSYAFYAVARDAVGNSEVQLTPLAETQTRVPLLADDSDGDGLPDWFEALIINANRFDALGSFAAVQPWDDFDGDGAVNLHEYQVGTDPIDRLSVPAAVAPSGAFQVVLGAAGVTAGNGLWDLTGAYSVAVAGQPLVMHLVHDSRGRLSGTATYTAAGGAAVNLSVLGTVSGRAGGAVLARIALGGSDVARTTSLDLAFTLTLNAGARQLRGPLVGAVRVGGVTTPVAATVALAIPAPMDGTWGLTFQLVPSGRSLSGTALLTLSNGVDYAFQVRGRSAGAAAVLTLTGAAGDPLASAISLRTTITPMLGQRAGLGALSGNGYGQTLRR